MNVTLRRAAPSALICIVVLVVVTLAFLSNRPFQNLTNAVEQNQFDLLVLGAALTITITLFRFNLVQRACGSMCRNSSISPSCGPDRSWFWPRPSPCCWWQ